TKLSAVDIQDRLLERPLDEPIRCVDVSQQKARRKSQFGQKREDVVGRVRSGGRPPRCLRGKECVEHRLAARGFPQIAGVAEMIGNGDVVIATEEHERDTPAHQLIGDWKHASAIEIDVEDCSFGRPGVFGSLFDGCSGTKDYGAHIAEKPRKISRHRPFVFDYQNMQPPQVAHVVILSWNGG
ncbi:hypothetical protein, partial [Mesorhizobium sp. M7A.T.Ca.TU.009.02.1.1]|uniref:hypothetical protein n=1 Tax=Mesorhizobium sp. M7A.T.Ca.TU.009.02.1.1 TaxID=2496791 RepID=UPI0013E38D2C